MMRIAVAYENGMVFQHFGHTQQFKVYEVEDGVVLREEIVDAAGSGHGALAGFLGGLGAEAVICGGSGAGAQAARRGRGFGYMAGLAAARTRRFGLWLPGH